MFRYDALASGRYRRVPSRWETDFGRWVSDVGVPRIVAALAHYLANDFVSDEAFSEMLLASFGNLARVLLPGLYMRQDRDEQRKLIDLIASNCTLQGGVPHVELKEVFAILADGAVRETEMKAAGASKSEIEKEWLPG